MTAKALILVDIQNDYFDGGAWVLPNMTAAAGNAARLLAAARQSGDLVIHIRHESTRPGSTFFLPGTVGAEIHPSVAPRPGEAVVTKGRPNSFIGTDLQDRLVVAGVSQIMICGAMSQMCIDATARAAKDLDYEVTVVEDACAAKEVSFGGQMIGAGVIHAAFMSALDMGYALVARTEELLEST